AGKTTSLRSCVTVVGGKAQTTQSARQEREVLQKRHFHTADPGAAGVNWLCRPEVKRPDARRRREVMKDQNLRDDRIGQALVKITDFNHAERVEIVFHEYVKIVGGFSS